MNPFPKSNRYCIKMMSAHPQEEEPDGARPALVAEDGEPPLSVE
jgi:hypothetical protein